MLASAAVALSPFFSIASNVEIARSQTATGQTQPIAPDQTVGPRGVVVLRPQGTATGDQTPGPVPAPPPPAPPPLPAPVVKTCDRPFAHGDVTLGRTGDFRTALRKRLARKSGAVIVNIASPFSVSGSTPIELAPWLAEVKASGGIVSVDTYCQESRGFFSFLRNMFGSVPQNAYGAADSYDAVFHVDGLVGVVTQVEFRPRTVP
jgi:hypothetical protein